MNLKLLLMKKIVVIIFLVNSVIGYSQENLWLGMPGGSLDLEDSVQYQYIKIDTNHVWFISKAEKQILFSITPNNNHSLITDTAAYYKSNVISSFNFKLCLDEGNFYNIQFWHKYDFEQNTDGGIIETSYDNGNTWQNIIYDTVIQNNIEDIVNFYDTSDTIISLDNQPGFTGLQSEYLASYIQFTANPDMYLDTMLLRFTIATDSVDSNNEGWMLDDFTFGGGYVALKDRQLNSEPFLYPNPTQAMLIIKSEKQDISQVSVLSVKGDTIIEKTGNNITSINIESLMPGYYLIICRSRNNNFWITKFCKV